jgi:hypothetical protein
MTEDAGATLPDEIYERIEELSERGDELADEEDAAGAEALWLEALALLPEPAVDWEAYTWLWASIGDVRYLADDAAGAADAFFHAHNGPGGIENPWIHYMLGKSLLRSDRAERGVDELMRAYMLDDDLFRDDEEEGDAMLDALRQAGARV